jgi:formate C-acetyltransferase
MTVTTRPPADTSRTGTSWRGFTGEEWQREIDVRSFIQDNYAPYEGDAAFLAGPTDRTLAVWHTVASLFPEERRKGILDVDTATPSTITSHAPGYIDRGRELIVGLQTDAPLKRAIMPGGRLRMVENGLRAYGFEPDPFVTTVFGTYRKTHNDGVFDAYTAEMLRARKAGIITGLPDAYGRGRIIGDYRRVALYGTGRLIEAKRAERARLDEIPSAADVIRDREELAEQIRALGELERMAASYGCDVSRPATTAHEAVQWLYLGFLAAVKEQNGAAMSLGRTSTFLDVYLQRDLDEGIIDESRAQELVDDFVIKLRIVRFLRTPEYDSLFSGDPTWVTESIGGIGEDGRPLVTRTSFRFLQTLYNLGPAPEPNLTVLWSPRLPEGFKRFCAQVSIDTSSLQYESDDLLRPRTGDAADRRYHGLHDLRPFPTVQRPWRSQRGRPRSRPPPDAQPHPVDLPGRRSHSPGRRSTGTHRPGSLRHRLPERHGVDDLPCHRIHRAAGRARLARRSASAA